MHAKSGLRVVLKWKIHRPDSVIADVIRLPMALRIRYSMHHLLFAVLVCAIAFWWLDLGGQWSRDRANKVPVVVRVNLKQTHGGDKFHTSTVQVIRVFKNETKEEIPQTLEISYLCWGHGIPSGMSTLYLVHHNQNKPEWGFKLYEPGALPAGMKHPDSLSTIGYTHHLPEYRR